jgi:hypothetical protein
MLYLATGVRFSEAPGLYDALAEAQDAILVDDALSTGEFEQKLPNGALKDAQIESREKMKDLLADGLDVIYYPYQRRGVDRSRVVDAAHSVGAFTTVLAIRTPPEVIIHRIEDRAQELGITDHGVDQIISRTLGLESRTSWPTRKADGSVLYLNGADNIDATLCAISERLAQRSITR